MYLAKSSWSLHESSSCKESSNVLYLRKQTKANKQNKTKQTFGVALQSSGKVREHLMTNRPTGYAGDICRNQPITGVVEFAFFVCLFNGFLNQIQFCWSVSLMFSVHIMGSTDCSVWAVTSLQCCALFWSYFFIFESLQKQRWCFLLPIFMVRKEYSWFLHNTECLFLQHLASLVGPKASVWRNELAAVPSSTCVNLLCMLRCLVPFAMGLSC